MRILLTNDDGIFSPGIVALGEALCRIAEVFVVAPSSEQSGVSQAITVHHPIRVDRYEMANKKINAWQVGGTPADCVKIGLAKLLDKPPDFVVSGINLGANLGTDVLYSGTVSAAREGAMNGIPSIAVSLDMRRKPDFTHGALFMEHFIPLLYQNKQEGQLLLNINIPDGWHFAQKEVRYTKLGSRKYENAFEKRLDPSGRTYYWMGGMLAETENDQDTDVAAIKEKKVSITPIHFDMTDKKALVTLEKMNFWQ